MPERTISEEIYRQSYAVMPGGVNSPVRSFQDLQMTPLIVKEGRVDTIIDVDGNSYIDYCGSWGALVLGYAHEKVVKAASDQLKKGSTFGIASESEYEIASFIVDAMDSIEKVRFVSSGTEAVMTAARLARGYTERPLIIKFNGGYHGHSDAFLLKAGSGVSHLNQESSSKGVLKESVEQTISLPYNDIEACRRLFRDSYYNKQIAAVILEPVAGNMGVVPASQEFLQMLREETEKIGTLLIFDEVISGFRVGLRGAQGYFGIQPDLTCLGKIVGGGFPAAVLGGRAEIMDHLAPLGGVYQAGTLSGNPVAMKAGLATLKECARKGFYEKLLEKTNIVVEPVKKAIQEENIPACINQIGSMFTIFWGKEKVDCREDLNGIDMKLFRSFFLHLFEKGIYFSPSPFEACFVSAAHTKEHLEYTRDVILEFALKQACAKAVV